MRFLWLLLPAGFLAPALQALWSVPTACSARGVTPPARLLSSEVLTAPEPAARAVVESRERTSTVAIEAAPAASAAEDAGSLFRGPRIPLAPAVETPEPVLDPALAGALPEDLVRELFGIEERLRSGELDAPARAELEQRMQLLSAALGELRRTGRFLWFLPPIESHDDGRTFEREYAGLPPEELAVEHWMLESTWQRERERLVEELLACGRYEAQFIQRTWG
jgi:hypothetical protein